MNIKIMRGIPGSGKSTYAQKHFGNYVHFSADHFFMTSEGYRFDGSKLDKAHATCLRNYINKLQQSNDSNDGIVIDNTNLSYSVLFLYVSLALAYECDVEIININYDPEVAWSRNQHTVPKSKVFRMYKQMVNANKNMPKNLKITNINE